MNKITELESDFGVIRATSQKIKAAIPKPWDAGGFSICPHFEDHYTVPTFTVCNYVDNGVIPMPRWAMFQVVNGQWVTVDSGDYAPLVDEMLSVLIWIFGGELG